MAFNLQEAFRADQGQNNTPLNWSEFQNLRNQVAQANQQMQWGGGQNNQQAQYGNMWQGQQEDQSSWLANDKDVMEDETGRRWRRVKDPVEGFFAGANDVTNALSSYSGWDPNAGWTPENIFRFGLGLPGMMVSSIPDALATGYEIVSGNPIKETVTDENTGEKWRPDEKLTASQIGADVGYLGLDALGFVPGLGVEAKIGGTLAKGIGKAGGIGSKAIRQGAEFAGEGLTKSAGLLENAAKAKGWQGNKLKAAAFGDTAADVAASTIFEGAQEAGQTAFEDIRYKQWGKEDASGKDTMDRMIEAGTWGSIGGLMPSVGLAGANWGLNKIKAQSSQTPTQQTGMDTWQPTSKDQWAMDSSNPSGVVTPAMQQHYLEQARNDRRLRSQGAVMVENVSADPNLLVDQARVGSEDFVETFYMGDKDAAAVSRQICNTTRSGLSQNAAVAETRKAIERRTVNVNNVDQQFDNVTDALNALRNKYWGNQENYRDRQGFRAAWEKSPATKNRGGYLDVVDFFDGKGVIVHPYVAPLTGMDFDGDQSGMHLSTFDENGNDTLNLIGYASQIMRHREGSPQSDIWYSDFHPRRYVSSAFKTRLQELFKPYVDGESIANKFATEMDEAVNSENDANYNVVKVLDAIGKRIDELRDDEASYVDKSMKGRTPGGRLAVNRAMDYISVNALASVDQHTKEIYSEFYADLAYNVIRDDTSISEETKKKLNDLFNDPRSPLYAKGRLGENARVGAHYEDLGLAYYTFVMEANQPFRQHAQLNLNFGKRQGAFTNLQDALNKFNLDQDVLDVLVRTSFRIARATTTPLSAIEGMLDAHTFDTAYKEAGLNRNKIATGDGFDSLLGALRVAYNRDSEVYEEVKKTEQQRGYEQDIAAVPRPPIGEKDTDGIMRVFLRIFGNTNMEEVFKEGIFPAKYKGYPIAEVVGFFGRDPIKFRQIFTEANNLALEEKFDQLVEAYGSEKKMSGRAVEKLIKDTDLHDVASRAKANGGKIAFRDYGAVRNFVNNIVEIISPNAAESFGLYDPIRFMENTVFGEMLLSGNEDQRINAVYCLLVKGPFIDVERVLNNEYDLSGEDLRKATDWANDQLQQFQQQSPLKALIASEILGRDDHKSTLLDGLSSINISYSDKMSVIKSRFEGMFPDMDPIADFMIEGNDPFSVSAISRKRARAQQSIVQYEKALFRESEEAIENLEKLVDTQDSIIDENVALAAIESAVHSVNLEISAEPYILAIADSLGTGLAWNEKGINPASFSSIGESQILNVNGGALAFIDQITSFASGAMSDEDFAANRKMLLSVLANRKQPIRIYGSGVKHKTTTITGDKIFAAVSPQYDPDLGPTFRDWMALLRRCPQLEGVIADNVTQPMMVNGEGGAGFAKLASLDKMVEQYAEIAQGASVNEDDARIISQIDYGIRTVGAYLLNDREYVSNIVHCMEDLGIPENATMAKIGDEFRRIHNAFATSYFFDNQWRFEKDGKILPGKYADMRNSYIGTIELTSIDNISTMLESIQDRYDEGGIKIADDNRAFEAGIRQSNRDDLKQRAFNAVANQLGIDPVELDDTDTEETHSDLIELRKKKFLARLLLMQLREINNEFAGRQIDPTTGQSYAEIANPTFGITEDYTDEVVQEAIDFYKLKHQITEEQERSLLNMSSDIYRRYKNRDIDDEMEEYDIGPDDLTDIEYVKYRDLPWQLNQADEAISALLDKIESIRKQIGDHNAFSDINQEALEGLYNEDGELSESKWLMIVRNIDSAIMQHSIMQLNLEWKADINKNAFMAQQGYISTFERLSDEVEDLLKNTPNPLNSNESMLFRDLDVVEDIWERRYSSSYLGGFPQPDFSRSMNMKAATDMSLGLSGGLVPGSIMRNGGSLKKCSGLGYLPFNTNGFIEPRPMTLGELRELYRADYGEEVARWKYVKVGTWNGESDSRGRDWDFGTLGHMLTDEANFADDAVIQVLHPDDNPNGIWVTNTPAVLSEKRLPSVRFPNLIGILLDTSQEAMVLKLKKRFEAKIKIADEYQYNTRNGYHIDMANSGHGGNTEKMMIQLRNLLLNYRAGYINELTQSFSPEGELSDLNWGRDQARIIAQGLTPGVIVSVENKDFVVSAEELWDLNAFESRLAQINGGQGVPDLGVCSVLSISPTEASTRINHETTRYNSEITPGAKPAIEESRRRALNVFTNWDDYFDDEFSIDEIIGMIAPQGRAHNGGLTTEESLTYVQRYLGLMHDRNLGARVGYVGKSGKALNRKTDPVIFDASQAVTKNVLGKKSQYQILRIFGVDNDQARAIYEREGGRVAEPLIHQSEDFYWPDYKKQGCAIVQSKESLTSAINYAERTGNHLLLTEEVYRTLTPAQRQTYQALMMPVNSDGLGKLYDINPAATTYDRAWSKDDRSSGNTTLAPSDIRGAYIDGVTARLYNPGDADIWGDPELAQYLNKSGMSKLNANTITGGNGRTEPLSKEDIAALKKLYDRNGNPKSQEKWEAAGFNFNAKAYENLDFKVIANRIHDYLDAYDNDKVDSDGVRRTGVGSGSVITLIKVTNLDNSTVIAPIIAPKNTPKVWDHCYFQNDRMGNIYLGYSSHLQVSGDPNSIWFFKMSFENEAFKGIISPIPENEELPTYGFGDNRQTISMVATHDTEKSRVPGRPLQLFQGSLWYFAKKIGSSYLYNHDGSPKKAIVDAYTETDSNGVSSIDYDGLKGLLNGDKSQWEKVARGDISLIPKGDPMFDQKNEVIKSIVSANLGKVPMVELFSNIRSDGSNSNSDIRYYMVFQNLDLNQTLLFFNGMDQSLCPNGCWDETDRRAFWFDRDGLFRISYKNKMFYAPVRWAPHNPIADFSAVEGVGGPANESNQALVRMGLEQGFMEKDLQTVMDFSSYLAGNPSFYHQRLLDKIEHTNTSRQVKAVQSSKHLADVLNTKYGTPKEIQAMMDVTRVGDMFSPHHRRDFYDNGKQVDNPYTDDRVRNAIYQLNQMTESNFSHRTIECFTMYITGHTFNDGKGINRISVQNYADAIIDIADNIKKEGLVVVSNKTVNGNRISQPLISPDLAQIAWDASSDIRNHPKNRDENNNPSFEVFKQRMMDEQDRADNIIAELPPRLAAKQREMWKASEWNNLQYGRVGGKRLYENIYSTDMLRSSNWLTEGLRQAGLGEDFDFEAYEMLEERTRTQIEDRRRLVDGRSHAVRTTDPTNPAGQDIVSYKNDRARGAGTFFRNATDLSRMMGVLDLWLPISNIGFRGINQTALDWIMGLGRRGVGPYTTRQGLNQKIVRGVAGNDRQGFNIWMVMHDAALTNDELEMLVALETDEDLQAWIDDRANDSRFNKWKNQAFRFASGGNWLMKKQYINFFNRFACFASEDPQLSNYWLTPDTNGYTRMDRMLAEPNGAAMFLKEVFGGRDGSSASYQAAMNAMQSVRTADMAQDHILIEIFKNATNKNPVSEWLLSTFVSRFPRYGLNFTEEILNYVMPVSSIRYVMTDFIAQRAHEKAAKKADYVDPHYELLQRNVNLKEAFLVDMLHLGPHLVAMLLAAIPGACEPPDDEKKWGNPDEWIICGARVGEVWWMEDILGLALPMVCFQKSVMLGKPRIDILTNGIAGVCYSNPMLKIADAVTFMMDPFDGLYADYEEMKAKYDGAKGGAPGFLDFINDNATTFGYSYAAQYFTPTFVKSAWNLFMPYEYDYRHVYKENARGVLTEEGSSGEKLTETEYDDAMLRRLTRKNPVLALVIDLTHPGNTSYSPLGFPGKMAMPLTEYNDQHQYQYMKTWSIKGLSEKDQQAKVAEILAKLEEYQDNLDALLATGFYLDSGTKAAVSAAIWDQYYGIDQMWNEMQQSGQLDKYVLGNGDYETGNREFARLLQLKKDSQKYYSDLYYKTMKSEQLTRPMITYNRYNTTYAQDDDGNWYATGFHPQGVLPFVSAPGRIGDAEGTAGYENDWVTISEADGRPLEGMRALVPTNKYDYEEWPDLKSWSADGEGEGYSAQYQKWNGLNSSTSSTKTTTRSPYSSGGSGYRRSGGGGGGGGSRGGGGRSYAPNTSAPNVNLSKANPSRIMSTDRLVRPDLEYLRPDFETKGSREAYRRSDI